MPDNLKAGKAPGKFLMTNASRIEPNDILIADGSMVHAVCWFYKHSDVYVLSAGELEYGLGYADSADRLLPYSKLGEFIKNAKVGRILLIAKDKTHVKWKLLPEPQFVDAREDFVFAEFAPGASVK